VPAGGILEDEAQAFFRVLLPEFQFRALLPKPDAQRFRQRRFEKARAGILREMPGRQNQNRPPLNGTADNLLYIFAHIDVKMEMNFLFGD